MKRNGKIFNARELRAARNITRWVASGCNWAEGAQAPIALAAKEILSDKAAQVRAYRATIALADELGDWALTQSVCSAAYTSVLMGDDSWAEALIEARF